MSKIQGIIRMSDVDHVSSKTIIENDFKKYGWEDDEEYFKKRLNEILEQLDQKYDIELAREKQALYFINDFYVRFN